MEIIYTINRCNLLRKLFALTACAGALIVFIIAALIGDYFDPRFLYGMLIIPLICGISYSFFDSRTSKKIEELKSESQEMKPKNKYKLFSKDDEFFMYCFSDEKIIIIISDKEVSSVKLAEEDIAEIFE